MQRSMFADRWIDGLGWGGTALAEEEEEEEGDEEEGAEEEGEEEEGEEEEGEEEEGGGGGGGGGGGRGGNIIGKVALAGRSGDGLAGL